MNEATLNREIVQELYRTLVLLGADHQLLGAIGSWADGQPEKNVLENIEAWNSATAQELKTRIQSYEESCSFRAYTPDAGRKIA
jgi:hypothetical protein